MANKILLTWNSRYTNELEEREHFHSLQEFVAKLPTLGLELNDAWITVYGDAPQILLGILPAKQQENHQHGQGQ